MTMSYCTAGHRKSLGFGQNNPSSLAVNQIPLVTELIPQALPIRLKQYPESECTTRHSQTYTKVKRTWYIKILCLSLEYPLAACSEAGHLGLLAGARSQGSKQKSCNSPSYCT